MDTDQTLAHYDRTTAADQLLRDLQQDAHRTAPDFVASMPEAYFDGTTQAMRLAHFKAILAAQTSGLSQTLTLREADGARYTFICNRSYPGQLGELIRRLPDELPLVSAQVFTATDGSRVLDIFHFGTHDRFDAGDRQQAAKAAAVIDRVAAKERDAVQQHLAGCDAAYLLDTPGEQILRHYRLVKAVRSTGDVLVRLEAYRHPDMDRLTLGIGAYDPRRVFERVSAQLGKRGIDICRAHLDSFPQTLPGDDIRLLSFLVQHQGRRLDPSSPLWHELDFTLRRLPHLDPAVFQLAETVTGDDLNGAELLLGLAHLAHQRLVKLDPFVYSRERILATLQRYPGLATAVTALMQARFDPDGSASAQPAESLAARIGRNTDKPDEQRIFETLVEAVQACLRSNHRLPHRHGLALRLDPAFFDHPSREVRPFGVFYLHGAGFDGFHVRFRDIARGGVRIVRPRGWEQYALESERHYDEVYGLAFAQQHKNKDIPEGGSKGVILAAPDADLEAVGRAYADGLLDLTAPDPALATLHADHYGQRELLYLGPDENISNALITWIVERARRRGHPMAAAFMSSKPGAGINHKQYGVTSEGVTVFLDAALRAVGIDPDSHSFTVKVTGGPDGDVAGNEIRILRREYGDRARIVGIADGSGCAEDPQGLDMDELLRLVDDGQPIAAFAADRLGSGGRLTTIDQPDGMALRNSLHNRLASDAFIPAGGRPATIHEGNWRDFLDGDGNPSSRVIVEGANLFITHQARQQLSEKGVLIVKDSSANKAGVICSSYEIIASMLLDEAGFLAIKERFVAEVLDKLRTLARSEADALLREHRHKPAEHLPSLSMRLSQVIDRATDAVVERVAELNVQQPQRVADLVLAHLPPVLVEQCGDQIMQRVPEVYLHRIIGCALASRIVYREGLDWLEQMPAAEIAKLAGRYLYHEARVKALAARVRTSSLEDREAIATLLETGGVAAALRQDTTHPDTQPAAAPATRVETATGLR